MKTPISPETKAPVREHWSSRIMQEFRVHHDLVFMRDNISAGFTVFKNMVLEYVIYFGIIWILKLLAI